MEEIKAIPTIYKGITLKSRMEAQCAVLFDKLRWEWEYEPWGFTMPSGISYVPDFWCKTCDTWIECRGYETPRSQRQLNEFISLLEGPRPDWVPKHVPTCQWHQMLLPSNGNYILHRFWLIGPKASSTYKSESRMFDIPASERYYLYPAMVFRCACGWRPLDPDAAWCIDCNHVADRVLVISVNAGKIYANGVAVEELTL